MIFLLPEICSICLRKCIGNKTLQGKTLGEKGFYFWHALSSHHRSAQQLRKYMPTRFYVLKFCVTSIFFLWLVNRTGLQSCKQEQIIHTFCLFFLFLLVNWLSNFNFNLKFKVTEICISAKDKQCCQPGLEWKSARECIIHNLNVSMLKQWHNDMLL